MIAFVLTKHGLTDLIDVIRHSKAAIWVNDGLLEEPDLERLRAGGIDLTNFTDWVDPTDGGAIQDAVETIKLHHPNQALFIESTL